MLLQSVTDVNESFYDAQILLHAAKATAKVKKVSIVKTFNFEPCQDVTSTMSERCDSGSPLDVFLTSSKTSFGHVQHPQVN